MKLECLAPKVVVELDGSNKELKAEKNREKHFACKRRPITDTTS
jgi:hypothetical protein